MAMISNRLHVRGLLLFFFFFTFFASMTCSPAPTRTGGKRIFRNRRQSSNLCPDGNYTSSIGTCCLCGIGQAQVTECVLRVDDRICKQCESGSYNDEPNHEKSCKPCRSCEQASANLEVDQNCSPGSNTICRCQKDHYCFSKRLDAPESCPLCHPCDKCGPEGIKTACTDTNNTVCNEEYGGLQPGEIVGIVVGVLVFLAALVGGVVVYRRIKSKSISSECQQPRHLNPNEEPLLLRDPHRSPYLPEIAERLGWKDMEKLAMRCGIVKAVIESCQLDKPGDSQAQTLQLLEIWVERQGRNASQVLISELNAIDKKCKAQEVIGILNN